MFDTVELSEDEGCLCILNGKGDTRIKWNKKKVKEIEEAEKMFNLLVKEKGLLAFSVGKFGRKGERVTEFNSNLGKVIIMAPIAGG